MTEITHKTVDTASVDLGKAALDLAATGQPVFPCHSSGEKVKRPVTEHGHKDATTDIETVRRWWNTHPGAAIGTPTGGPWPTVLDFDVRQHGDSGAALEALLRAGLLRGCFRIVRTPRGGLHLYFPVNPAVAHIHRPPPRHQGGRWVRHRATVAPEHRWLDGGVHRARVA